MYAATKELPDSIKNALKGVGFGRESIEVHFREQMQLSCSTAFEGNRSFVLVIDLATGENRREVGSWGGGNPFEHKAVDCDEKEYPIPMNVAIVKGESGGRGCFARLYLNPANVVPGLLPAADVVEKRIYDVCKAHKSLKSGPYRKAALEGKEKDIDEAVNLGLIKRDGRGTQITTAGRNAVEAYEKNKNNG